MSEHGLTNQRGGRVCKSMDCPIRGEGDCVKEGADQIRGEGLLICDKSVGQSG